MRHCAPALCVLIIAGCVKVDPRAGLPEVKQQLAGRLDGEIHWRTNGPEDQAVDRRVGELLTRPLSAEEAVQIALLNNRRLQIEYERLGIAQADLVQAGLLKNPVLDGDVKFPEGGGGAKIELTVVADFLQILMIPLRKSIARAELERTRIAVVAAVMDLAGEVRSAHVRLQAAEQAIELRRTTLEASEASFELARRIRQAGNSTQLDVDSQQAFYEEALLAVTLAEADAAAVREELTALMGLENSKFSVASPLPELPADEIAAHEAATDELERKAIERSLDLAMARLEIERAAKNMGITKPLGVLSELELGVAFEQEEGAHHEIGPAFSLPLPLFSQGQPALASAQAQLRQAEHRRHAIAVEVRSAVRAAHLKTVKARARARQYLSAILPLRQRIVEESQRQYNGMQIGAFQLLQAKRDQIEAGATYIRLLRDYWLARAELQQLLNGRAAGASNRLEAPEPSRSSDPGGH